MEKKLSKKGEIEISFAWLFSIVAGIVIIFFAIYITTKLMSTESEAISAKTGKEIGILLNPLETGFESAQSNSIIIPAETRINNECSEEELFGKQYIQLDQKSFNKWSQTNVKVNFDNKYIFSEEKIEGKEFYIFSKPFYFPFKVADLFYMTSSKKEYCFVGTPSDIRIELANLNQTNLKTENCSDESVKVCFDDERCDINVDYEDKAVKKGMDWVYFSSGDNSLLYAAIFSDKDIYECQLKRLMARAGELALIYSEKESLGLERGCDENLGGSLNSFSEAVRNLNESDEIVYLGEVADSLDMKNEGRICLLW